MIKESEEVHYEAEGPDGVIEGLSVDVIDFNLEGQKPIAEETKIGFSLADSIKGLFKNEKTPQQIKRE